MDDVERPERERDRGGDEQRIENIKESAEARDVDAGILTHDVALNEGFREVANRARYTDGDAVNNHAEPSRFRGAARRRRKTTRRE